MSVTINGTTGVDTPAVTADSTNVLNLKSEGVTRAYVSASGLTVNRINSASEGGQLDLCRSSDGASAWAVDVYGDTSTPSLRFVDNVAGATRMQIDGSGTVTVGSNTVMGITRGTAVASTSGTSIDFTGIPSWAKRITVMFNGVSTNSGAYTIVQIGSGSIITTGYSGRIGYIYNGTVYITSITSGLGTDAFGGAIEARIGIMVIDLISSNTYVSSAQVSSMGSAAIGYGNGAITLSGALDRIRITTSNGTDTFDAGSINILYE